MGETVLVREGLDTEYVITTARDFVTCVIEALNERFPPHPLLKLYKL